MAKLDNLRQQVVDMGIIPRREGKDGLPTEVYYLRVKELAHLVDNPEDSAKYIEIARARSKKRRRARYLKEKFITEAFDTTGGHTNRLLEIFKGAASVECLGKFTSADRFMSETGFERAKVGFVYVIGGSGKLIVTESEAHRLELELGVSRVHCEYKEDDLDTLIWNSKDRIYKSLNYFESTDAGST